MSALTNDRDTLRLAGVGADVDQIELPVKGATVLFAGALALKETVSGLARPVAPGSGLEIAGRVERRVDATGLADGALTAVIRRGVFKYAAEAGQVPDVVDSPAFALDDQTFSKAAGALTIGTGNGALTITSKVTGLSVRVVVAGNDTVISSSVSNGLLTVNSATGNAGAATSTADAIIAEITANQAATASAARAAGSNGTGVTGAVGTTVVPVRASSKVHRIDPDGVWMRCGI